MTVSIVPAEAKAPLEEINRGLVWIFQERETAFSHKEYLYRQLFFQGRVFAFPILSRIVSIESGWQEDARNTRSSAKGLFQIINGTWQHFACVGNPLDGFDSIDCALKIYTANEYKDWCADKNSKRLLKDICYKYE